MKKILILLALFIMQLSGAAIDISSDGRSCQVEPGGSVVKYITLLNREELPRWIRISLQDAGPLPEISTPNIIFQENTALGWTHIVKGWQKVMPQKMKKIRVEFLPPRKTLTGEYGVWLLFEQMNTSPRVLSEEQRGSSLQASTVQTYFLPVIIKVQKK